MSNDPSRLFSSDYREHPFWWERTPRPAGAPAPLPKTVEVLVNGSGSTGLCAALQTARGGRATLVIDSAEPGWGCSSRNGGQVSTGIKPDYASLEKEFGSETALEVHREGQRALSWIGDFIQNEAIDCDYRVCGRFFGAHTARHYDKLAEKLSSQPPELEMEAYRCRARSNRLRLRPGFIMADWFSVSMLPWILPPITREFLTALLKAAQVSLGILGLRVLNEVAMAWGSSLRQIAAVFGRER